MLSPLVIPTALTGALWICICIFGLWIQRASSKLFRRVPRNIRSIQPLIDFDFTEFEPLNLQPYKAMAHVSMGITKTSMEEWISIDKQYLSRLAERQQTMDAHPTGNIVFGTGPLVNPAIRELYKEVMMHYLPFRYPSIFRFKKNMLVNLVTGKDASLDMDTLDEHTMLSNLSQNVEEDFYIMCPDEEDEIRLQGYIACFPGGFSSPERLGTSMREIHGPVPGYQQRIAKGADAYLKKMAGGQFITRMNWSLQTDGPDLWRMDGNNFYPEQGHVVPENKLLIDIKDCYLRVERQTLTRLRNSRAIIFTVRSFMRPLAQVKAEGDGKALAAAIRSMPEKLGDYKKRPFWDKEVYAFLESDDTS